LILKLHETTKENIESMNAKYKIVGDRGRKHDVFDVGDLVWLHLSKDRFPDMRKSKLMARADAPFKVLEKSMIIHINLSCMQILVRLVLHLTLQI
jgi:hypothetical protein